MSPFYKYCLRKSKIDLHEMGEWFLLEIILCFLWQIVFPEFHQKRFFPTGTRNGFKY